VRGPYPGPHKDCFPCIIVQSSAPKIPPQQLNRASMRRMKATRATIPPATSPLLETDFPSHWKLTGSSHSTFCTLSCLYGSPCTSAPKIPPQQLNRASMRRMKATRATIPPATPAWELTVVYTISPLLETDFPSHWKLTGSSHSTFCTLSCEYG
jgi:hypothetical protein